MTAKLPVVAAVVAGFCLAASHASATMVDFSDLENSPWNLSNNGLVPNSFGDTAFMDFTYRSLQEGNHWGSDANSTLPGVQYWADGNFSGDDAIHAPKHNEKLEIRLDAAIGYVISSVTFHLGGRPNQDQNADYKIYDASWSLLGSADNFFVEGTAGALIAMAPLSTSLIFQLGNTWDVGVNWVSYEVQAVDTPLPAGALLLLTGLLGVGGAGRMRKAA